MLAATIGLETMLTHRCPACGTPHRIRAATAADSGSAVPERVGFFGRCPETGFREWLVVEVPGWEEGVRVVAFGPPDDDTWEPLDVEALERTWRSWSPSADPEPGPQVNFHPRSARAWGTRGALGQFRESLGESRS